jgi:SET and MYND domain-containing protein
LKNTLFFLNFRFSQACQARAWKSYHKYECKLFGRLHPRILPTQVRGLLRLLMLRDNAALPDSNWQALLRLRSHADDFKEAGDGSGSESWGNICLMSQAAAHYSGTKMDEHLVRSLFCRVCL